MVILHVESLEPGSGQSAKGWEHGVFSAEPHHAQVGAIPFNALTASLADKQPRLYLRHTMAFFFPDCGL
ncbi:hypothetical protein D3C72_2338410 [compost metagenome]